MCENTIRPFKIYPTQSDCYFNYCCDLKKQNQKHPNNSIHRQSIFVPNKKGQCFQKWLMILSASIFGCPTWDTLMGSDFKKVIAEHFLIWKTYRNLWARCYYSWEWEPCMVKIHYPWYQVWVFNCLTLESEGGWGNNSLWNELVFTVSLLLGSIHQFLPLAFYPELWSAHPCDLN